jgi:tetratricopeptide (TPR) repeat protein
LLARAIELTKSSADLELRATVLCEGAYAASLLGRPEEAAKLIDEGLQLSQPDANAAVHCLRDRAFIAQNANDQKAALQYATQAQKRLHESGAIKPDLEAQLLADIGAAHYLDGNNAAAERYYKQALDEMAKMGRSESPGVSFLRNNWGMASFASGDPRRALEQYDEALRLAVQKSVEGKPPPYLLHNRAAALSALARYPEALKAYDVAFEAATDAGNAAVRIGAIAGRANTYALMGDVSRTESELAVVTPEVGKTIPADSSPAMTIGLAQARVDAARGRLPEAITRLTKIVEFFDGRQMAVAPLVRVLIFRADVYLQQANESAAIADAQRALEISRALEGDKPYSSLTGQSLLVLARIQESRGQHIAAQAAAKQALPHLTEALGSEHPDTVRAQQFART